MDTARDKNTLEHADAEDLWHISVVDQDRYICIGCRLKATPCSYDRKVNKKRPYFRFDDPDDHEEGCFYKQDIELIKKAKKKSISTREGFPLSHPSVLSLDDQRAVENPQDNGLRAGIKSRKQERNGSPSETNRKHNYSVKTINSIAKHYLKCPFDRRNMPLKIDGVKGENYNEVIKQLPDEIVVFQEMKLRFGRLDNYKEATSEGSKIIIPLLSGCWLNNRPYNTYKLIIDATGWSEGKRNYILDSVKASQAEFREKKIKGTFVFFMGYQMKGSPNKFVVSDYRLFTSTGI